MTLYLADLEKYTLPDAYSPRPLTGQEKQDADEFFWEQFNKPSEPKKP